jgi:uncharacterized protein YdaU (DUF1376 family)
VSAPPYMPLYVGDYLADTTHLTCTEQGAYMLLLMCMWRSGGSLPDDDAKLAKFTRCTRAQWDRIRPVLIGFFTAEGGQLTQGRLARELTKHASAVEQRRQAGSNGGKAKSLKDKETDLAGATISPCQPEPEPEPSKAVAIATAPRKRASKRVPLDWIPSDGVLEVGQSEGFNPGEIERELSKMRDHEFRSARSDWDATARKWLREAADRRPKLVNRNDRPDSSPFSDNLARAFSGSEIAIGAGRG